MADELDARAAIPGSEPVGGTDRDGRARPHELEGLPPELRERLGGELIDQLLAGAKTQEEIVGPGGVLAQLTKRLVERAMDAELSDHLGYERGGAPPGGAGNARNGSTPKTLRTDHGPVRVETPRDRQGSFEPRILPKRTTRFAGFDDKIIALYARGMSVRDIQAYIGEL
jgi:putative transposase